MANPIPTSFKIPVPNPPAPSGPVSVVIPAGKTVLLLNGTNVVLLKSMSARTVVWTGWTVKTYDDMASAEADIAANKWTVNKTTTEPISPVTK